MGKREIQDRREELMEKFKDTFDRYLNPAEHQNVRLRDVEDARQDVVDHINMLAREGIIDSEGKPKKAE